MPRTHPWDWALHFGTLLRRCSSVRFFKWDDEVRADVCFVIKQLPSPDWFERLSQKVATIYMPMDFFGSTEEIHAARTLLQQFDRIVVQCDTLQANLSKYSQTECIELALPTPVQFRR